MMKRCDTMTGEPSSPPGLWRSSFCHGDGSEVEKSVFFLKQCMAWRYQLFLDSALIFGKGLNLNIIFLSQSCTNF